MAAHFLCSTLLLLILLLLLSSTQMKYSFAGSRPILLELSGVAKEAKTEEMVRMGSRVGSRPPNCEGRCSSCGHCEAVEVPLHPLEKEKMIPLVDDNSKKFSATIDSRGGDDDDDDEYSSNYKPINWKCKCGGIIFNP